MTDITIPPEALEAAAEAEYYVRFDGIPVPWKEAPDWVRNECLQRARAACLAMLKAWPEQKEEWRDNINMLTGAPIRYAVLILPLQESTDDK